MPTNDFKPFATGAGANVMSQADWVALTALATGFQSGKASSAQVNKALRQSAFIASALAQYTANKTGLDVLDDGDITGFITKMHNAFGADFQPLDATLTAIASLIGATDKLPYFNGADTAALTDFTSVGRDIIGKSTAAKGLSYLSGAPIASPTFTGTPSGPTASPGTNTTQFATTAFVQAAINILAPTGSLSSGIIRLPMYNGSTVETLILQWMAAPALAAGGNATITFPTAFPNALLSLMATGGATAAGVPGINTFSIGATSCRIYNQSTSASTQAGAIWALGK